MNELARDIDAVADEHGLPRHIALRLWVDMQHTDGYPYYDRSCHLDPESEGVVV